MIVFWIGQTSDISRQAVAPQKLLRSRFSVHAVAEAEKRRVAEEVSKFVVIGKIWDLMMWTYSITCEDNFEVISKLHLIWWCHLISLEVCCLFLPWNGRLNLDSNKVQRSHRSADFTSNPSPWVCVWEWPRNHIRKPPGERTEVGRTGPSTSQSGRFVAAPQGASLERFCLGNMSNMWGLWIVRPLFGPMNQD